MSFKISEPPGKRVFFGKRSAPCASKQLSKLFNLSVQRTSLKLRIEMSGPQNEDPRQKTRDCAKVLGSLSDGFKALQTLQSFEPSLRYLLCNTQACLFSNGRSDLHAILNIYAEPRRLWTMRFLKDSLIFAFQSRAIGRESEISLIFSLKCCKSFLFSLSVFG